MSDTELSSAVSRLDAVKDVMTVKRVFGDAYQVDTVSVIPVPLEAEVKQQLLAEVGVEEAPPRTRGRDPEPEWASASTRVPSASTSSRMAPSSGVLLSTSRESCWALSSSLSQQS